MKDWLLELIACPVCGGDLSLRDQKRNAEEITDGRLHCRSCDRSFRIDGGIARLVPEQEVDSTSSFSAEFTALADSDADLDPFDLRRYFFYSRTGIDTQVFEEIPGDPYRTEISADSYRPDGSFLADKIVLDAGCGPGRFTEVAASDAYRVVGLELGDHIERAADRCRELENTDFVQGSVLQPPFRKDVFDYAFSIGVLHHTPDPAEGSRAIAATVQSGGAMSVWVYSDAYWGGRIRGWVAKRIHRRLSSMSSDRALAICSGPLFKLGQLQMKLARNHLLKLLGAPLFLINVPRHPRREVMIATIVDYYTPRFISTHRYNEVETWLRSAGFSSVRPLPVPVSVLATEKDAMSRKM